MLQNGVIERDLYIVLYVTHILDLLQYLYLEIIIIIEIKILVITLYKKKKRKENCVHEEVTE